jgi:predicted ATP-grasp superfamily ATP-dependent carboligase
VSETADFMIKRIECILHLRIQFYRLKELEREAAQIRKEIAKLIEELKQLESDHNDYLDSCFTVSNPSVRKTVAGMVSP